MLKQQTTAAHVIRFLGLGGLSIAFLLPVGDAPWFSFWREWSAALAVLLIVLSAVSGLRAQGRKLRTDLSALPIVALGAAVIPWLQWTSGIEFYRGDALLVSIYLLGFALCIVVAQSLNNDDRARLADGLALALLCAALCSVPLATLQWAGWLRLDLEIKVVAGRPVAHMEQTNLLCSLLLQGVFAAWRLQVRGRLAARWAIAIAIPILFCASLTQSRVAWIVAAATLVAWAWCSRTAPALRRCVPGLGIAVLMIVAGAIAVPWLDQALGFTGLTMADRMGGGADRMYGGCPWTPSACIPGRAGAPCRMDAPSSKSRTLILVCSTCSAVPTISS